MLCSTVGPPSGPPRRRLVDDPACSCELARSCLRPRRHAAPSKAAAIKVTIPPKVMKHMFALDIRRQCS